MDTFSPERLRRRRLYTTIRALSAAGILALAGCGSSHPADTDASPIYDVPSPVSPCEIPEPTCYPSPTPTETESPEPTESPSPSPTRTKPPLPRGFACKWKDVDGERQPLVSEHPLRAKIDGRCRKPNPLAPVNVYANPDLEGPVIDTVENGDRVDIVCAMRGKKVVRDAQNASRLILGIKPPLGEVGFISEIRIGFLDETQQSINGNLPPCDP